MLLQLVAGAHDEGIVYTYEGNPRQNSVFFCCHSRTMVRCFKFVKILFCAGFNITKVTIYRHPADYIRVTTPIAFDNSYNLHPNQQY